LKMWHPGESFVLVMPLLASYPGVWEGATPGKYGGGRAFWKLSNRSEVLLHCIV